MRLTLSLAAVCWVMAFSAAAQQSDKYVSTWVAPAKSDARQNPLANLPDALAGGKKLFKERCAVCHGEDGAGTRRGPNLTLDRVHDQSDGALFWKITSGNTRTGMPSFSFLPEPQRWQLVLSVRALTE